MKHLFILFLIVFSLLQVNPCHAQTKKAIPENRPWNASWIAAPNDEGTEYGVYYFRKHIELATKPATFIIHVSADNRYKLYVNEKLVSLGPARGDIYYWNYETVDLAPYLAAGKNIVSAVVWNEAAYRPEAQITVRTGFILQGGTANEDILNTDKTWTCIKDKGYRPIPGYGVASAGELVDMNQTVKGWMTEGFNDSTWLAANHLDNGHLKGTSDGYGWMLVPSSLPQMELTYQRILSLRKADGMLPPKEFPATITDVTIPPNSSVSLLLDQTYLTSAYTTLNFSKGAGAGISISYAESLYDNLSKYGSRKSNRNDIEGKDFSGRMDSIISSGGNGQSFTTLYWRTYRYVRVRVQTKEEPLVINDIYGTFTGYPFKQEAKFNTDNKEIKDILAIGWRTARLDAMETYMDCPYYEQLQYIGDTRIQTMISYYNSSDDRLARNAIDLMDHSRLAEGVTLSRYPTHSTQIISTFSLWYIGMLYDYWMYRPDSNFIKDKLAGERAVLDFFSKYQQPDGSLKDTPYWTFVDWANGKDWNFGSAPKGGDGSMAILDLQLLWAYQWAAAMEAKMGLPDYSNLYNKKAALLKLTIRQKYWDPVKKLFADTKEKTLFSQHANSLAILTGMVKDADMRALATSLLKDSTLTQCTIYFKYYLHQALVEAGMGDDYIQWLDIWRNNIKMGLTTWAEESNLNTTRSDCHAWGASPNIEFFRTVLGIDTDSPGFTKVKITPHPGTLTHASGEIPHAGGAITVSYLLENNKWTITISLPDNTTGTLIWKAKKYALKAGRNSFII